MSLDDKRLKVLFVGSEVAPYAKSGGLGDVIAALPKALARLSIDARVVFPKYQSIKLEYLEGSQYIDSFNVKLGWRSQNASIFQMSDEITGNVPTYMIENSYYFGRDGFYGYGDDFERFAFFSKASIEFLSLIDFKPDVIHFNDWQTALGPLYLKDYYKRYRFFSNIKTLFTIHNIQYQGMFGSEILGMIDLNSGYFTGDKLEFYGKVNYLKSGIVYSDAISTVSETYAREIQTHSYSYGMDGVLRSRAADLYGIINGIDTDMYNPETDKNLTSNYNADSADKKNDNKLALQRRLNLPERADVPMFAVISRLADQKGFDLIAFVMDELMARDIQLVVLGTGDSRYEHLFWRLAEQYPDKLSANILFNEELARQIYASADIFLMPSLFEPCGLGQIISMRYGTIPVVRKTGGLSDTVSHFDKDDPESTGNGFLFEDYLASGLMWAINRATDCFYDKESWRRVVQNAMHGDFSWPSSAEKYIELYEKLGDR